VGTTGTVLPRRFLTRAAGFAVRLHATAGCFVFQGLDSGLYSCNSLLCSQCHLRCAPGPAPGVSGMGTCSQRKGAVSGGDGNRLVIRRRLGLQTGTFPVMRFHCPAFAEPLSTGAGCHSSGKHCRGVKLFRVTDVKPKRGSHAAAFQLSCQLTGSISIQHPLNFPARQSVNNFYSS